MFCSGLNLQLKGNQENNFTVLWVSAIEQEFQVINGKVRNKPHVPAASLRH